MAILHYKQRSKFDCTSPVRTVRPSQNTSTKTTINHVFHVIANFSVVKLSPKGAFDLLESSPASTSLSKPAETLLLLQALEETAVSANRAVKLLGPRSNFPCSPLDEAPAASHGLFVYEFGQFRIQLVGQPQPLRRRIQVVPGRENSGKQKEDVKHRKHKFF